ncbi:SPARC precursor, putative [Pediculus humanus corporis]|uniref:SPARC, putative n=1 Tax=Pediculus humanus subsp. corporis TaxID=121224 RepID=E0VRZ2_PEDHC|nr:SPARC precursor, putative [Pediculus humanus corporis]EEB16148.1 SPARC precursor, putative [Pediculus humanus corporis]
METNQIFYYVSAKPQAIVEIPPEPYPIRYEEQPQEFPEENFEDNLVETEEKKEEIDLCATKRCGAGKICDVVNGKAECVCVPTCPTETDVRRKVCTNHNETWNSDCEVYQMRCFCDHNNEACRGEKFKHIHIDYYGPCKQLPACLDDEMADFPRRMREWLFNIMRDMADRHELSDYYLKMEREAETNYTRKWTNSAIWKWCDLDEHPQDRSVSRHELFPIRAPLLALEHCIAPFLDKCDENNDHKISLNEWGKCLELPEDDLEERCEDLRSN